MHEVLEFAEGRLLQLPSPPQAMLAPGVPAPQQTAQAPWAVMQQLSLAMSGVMQALSSQ